MSAAAPQTASTLDEPILATVARDLRAIGRKMLIVALPPLGGENELRDWDLWGPLLLCCILAMILGGAASSDQSGVLLSDGLRDGILHCANGSCVHHCGHFQEFRRVAALGDHCVDLGNIRFTSFFPWNRQARA